MKLKGIDRAIEHVKIKGKVNNAKIDFLAGYNKAIEDTKAVEMFNLLKKSITEISRIKGSMMAHPDCTNGSEFEDYVNSAYDFECEIKELINKIENEN